MWGLTFKMYYTYGWHAYVTRYTVTQRMEAVPGCTGQEAGEHSGGDASLGKYTHSRAVWAIETAAVLVGPLDSVGGGGGAVLTQ